MQINTRLADEITRMSNQERREIMHGIHNASDSKQGKLHIQRLKEIVETEGWPSPAMVGEGASLEALGIVEHSSDEEFQKLCLKKMRELQKKERNNILSESINRLIVKLNL